MELHDTEHFLYIKDHHPSGRVTAYPHHAIVVGGTQSNTATETLLGAR